MAKYLGVDYGAKRVGIALSDDSGMMAFPRTTFANDSSLLPALIELARNEKVVAIVIGESKDKDGKDNPVMAAARSFGKETGEALAVPIIFEPEYYSSVEARRLSEEAGKTGRPVDAEAASIILNRYLERLPSTNA